MEPVVTLIIEKNIQKKGEEKACLWLTYVYLSYPASPCTYKYELALLLVK
jgi:hypothetical protein